MATRRFFDGAQIEIGSLPIEGAAGGLQTIVLDQLASTATVYNPTVVRQASKLITLNRLESTAQIYLPVVTQAGGVQTITLNRLESTAQIYLPTVIQAGGVQTITLNLLGSTAQIYLPTITQVSSVVDTSDILSRGLKRRKYRLTQSEEEQIAAQLLKERQSPIDNIESDVNWRALIYNAVHGITNIDQLNALDIPLEGITSPSATAALLAELEKQKELRRIELEIKQKEAELKAIQLTAEIQEREAAIVAAITKQQEQLQAAKTLQEQVLERHRIAQDTAMREEMQSYLEALKAEKEYEDFKRKRDNRIKRLKALMWLAKLDL